MTTMLHYLSQVNIQFKYQGHFINKEFIGNYTDKYWKAKELFAKLTNERGLPKIKLPNPPQVEKAAVYGKLKIKDYISFEDILSQIKPIVSNEPKHMELLNIGSNYGQNWGFITYRVETNKFKHLKLTGI